MIRVWQWLILPLLQIGAIIATFWLIQEPVANLLEPYLPGYDDYAASKDIQAVAIVVLLWDRYLGPTSVLLRRATKLLAKNKKKGG